MSYTLPWIASHAPSRVVEEAEARDLLREARAVLVELRKIYEPSYHANRGKRASDLQAENTSLEQELAALRSKLQTAMEAPKSAACVIL